MWIRSLLAAGLLAAFTIPTLAQAPAPAGTPTRVRGTVEKLEGNSLTVKTREGTEVTVALADQYKILAMKRVRLSSIKQNDYVGAAAVQGSDGKLHAQEVQVLPENMRGVGDGHYPWDLTPDSTMTNGTVAQVSKTSRGRVLHLQYKDGAQDVAIAPRTPIVTFVPGTVRLLKPGRAVVVFARKMPDGTYTAGALAIQRGKVTPPM